MIRAVHRTLTGQGPCTLALTASQIFARREVIERVIIVIEWTLLRLCRA